MFNVQFKGAFKIQMLIIKTERKSTGNGSIFHLKGNKDMK